MTRKKQRYPNDPNAKREQEKYEQPIPSREFILETLEKHKKFIDFYSLSKLINVKSDDDKVALTRRLNAMRRDGQIMQNRNNQYGLISKTDLLIGKVQAFKDGHGFVICEDEHDDIYLSAYQMQSVMHGDRVLVSVSERQKRASPEGVVVEILSRAIQKTVGRLHFGNLYAYVSVKDTKVTHNIIIPPEHIQDAHDGQIVEVEVLQYPNAKEQAIGKITAILGEHMAPGIETEIAIRINNIPNEWPEAVLSEAEAIPAAVTEEDIKGRVDLRDKPFVTIDGKDARDFDDAVYCEPLSRGAFKLYVAIADVSHYVKLDSALDMHARERGNSVYFPTLVVPMLPESLSNGICSLKPEVDRLCFVCEMEISSKGILKDYTFYEAVMHSHARLTYEQVADILEGDNHTLMEQCADLLEHLYSLYSLYQVLEAAREKRGCLSFDTTETVIHYGDDKKIDRIEPVERRVSHKLIEECMLCANIASADLLQKEELPGLYRNHEPPPLEKVLDLRKFLNDFKLKLPGGETPIPKDFSTLSGKLFDREDKSLIETVMLRTMSQARYEEDNKGHFGLAYDAYTHFTSPIRRYPDLHLHRVIKNYLNKKKTKIKQEALVELGEQFSMTERRADEATRDVVQCLKCEYMVEKVGEEFYGVVSSVTNFGLFIQLDDIYIEGLAHVTSLPNDYYHYESTKHLLVGENSGLEFKLGDRVLVSIIRVDVDDRKIDFKLVETSETKRRSVKKPKKSSKQKKQKRREKK